MKLRNAVTLEEVSGLINAEFSGDARAGITGINEIHKVTRGDLTFVDHPKYYDRALQSEATFILINKEVDCPDGKGLIFSDDPFRDYNILVHHYSPVPVFDEQISADAQIGTGTILMPGVAIGKNVAIGAGCLIHPNVVIYENSVIGNGVVIHANTTIGADAFYFKTRKERAYVYDKLHSCGRVVIGDEVEIGSNCSIDKGVSGDTLIGSGTKIDNQVHIGHGVEIGRNCLFAAQVGIAGKTIIGDNVILWGQVGVSKDLTIGDNTIVLAQSGVKDSIAGNKVYFGSPVQEARQKMKELAMLKSLPEIWRKMKGL